MTLRRVSALLAVGALVALSLTMGSTSAIAAPNPPTVDQTQPVPWITDAPQPQIHGTTDTGVNQIDVEFSSDNGASYSPYCTIPILITDSTWDCLSPSGTLALGDNLIRASATDGVPSTSAPGTPITITVVNTPTVAAPADDLFTNDYQPTFSGTAELSYFDVVTTAPSAATLCSGTVVGTSWNCTPATMAEGDYTYQVRTTYLTNTIYSAPRTLHIDTTAPPQPTISAPLNPTNSFPLPTISGVAESFATVDLQVDGLTSCSASADYTGAWSCVLGSAPSNGPHALTALQTDQAGNLSPLSLVEPINIADTTPPAPPQFTYPTGPIGSLFYELHTNNTSPTFSGTGEPSATIAASVDGSPAYCLGAPQTVDVGGNWSCTIDSPFPDGPWSIRFAQADPFSNLSAETNPYTLLTIDTVPPGAPAITSPVDSLSSFGYALATTSNTRPQILGTGQESDLIQLYRDGSFPVVCSEGQVFVAGGSFSCTLATALTPGTHDFSFVETDRSGNSSGSPVMLLRLTVLEPPPPPPAPVPVQIQVPTWLLQFQADDDTPNPGENVTLTGSDLPPGATVVGELHSTPIPLGSTHVLSDGTFRLNTVIPNTTPLGNHNYVVTVTPLNGSAQTVQVPVKVIAATTALPPKRPAAKAEAPKLGNFADSAAARAMRNRPTSPNTLTHSLPAVQQIVVDPLIVAAAAASALALLFLVAIPAELLNSTIDEHYERIFGRFPRLKFDWLLRWRARLARAPIIGGLALTTLAAVIFGFSDPHFGFDLVSLRLLLASLISMFVLGYVANWITAGVLMKRWQVPSAIDLQAFGLVLALLGVLLSRILDFSPGLLVGLVLTLALGSAATKKDELRYVLVWAAAVLGLSIFGWVSYSILGILPSATTFGGALLGDTLVAVATAGVASLIIGLLPIGYLDGRTLFLSSRIAWLITYLIVLIAFFVIVVPSGTLWGGIHESFWIWLSILVTFALACVSIYLFFRFHRFRDLDNNDEVPAEQLAESAK